MKFFFKKYLVILLLLWQCKPAEKSEEPPLPQTDKGNIRLHIHSMLDSIEIKKIDTTYMLHTGDSIYLSEAKVMLTNFGIFRRNGSLGEVLKNQILVDYQNYNYKIGDVEIGNYSGIDFEINNATNDSRIGFANTPTSLSNAFIHLKGKVIKNGLSNHFDIVIGTEKNSIKVPKMEKYFSVNPNRSTFLHLNINYMQLLRAIDYTSNQNMIINTIELNETENAKKINKNHSFNF